MSNPSNTDATQQKPAESKDQETASTEEKDPVAIAEQRRRDTQAAYTKGQQQIKALEAERTELIKLAEKAIMPSLTTEQQTELADLKYSDPEAWRAKLNSYETTAQSEARAKLQELTGSAREAAERDFELSQREQILKTFNESARVQITDEVIANEVPPRITSKLAEGKVTFEDFLKEVDEYLHTGKVVKTEETLDQPNLGTVGGTTTPSDTKVEKSLSDSYKNDLY